MFLNEPFIVGTPLRCLDSLYHSWHTNNLPTLRIYGRKSVLISGKAVVREWIFAAVRKYRVECQQCVHNSSNTLHTCHACCYEAETRRDEAADRSSRDSTLSAVRLPSVIFLGRRKTRKKSTIMNSFGKSRASTDNSTTSSSMGSSCDYAVCCRTSPIDPMKCVVLS
ncbi:hypothetical protein QE152_g10086 [Popillia japonica]|uniref:Uncharacterized protein n=1 Tax=Popillia japonica TaxID=7064 RepID=A0AAW1LWK8_POPJA